MRSRRSSVRWKLLAPVAIAMIPVAVSVGTAKASIPQSEQGEVSSQERPFDCLEPMGPDGHVVIIIVDGLRADLVSAAE